MYNIENERLNSLKSCIEIYKTEEKIKEIFGPNTIGRHEVVHTLSIFNNMLGDYVLEHPSTCINKKAYELVFEAEQLLQEVYRILATEEK